MKPNQSYLITYIALVILPFISSNKLSDGSNSSEFDSKVLLLYKKVEKLNGVKTSINSDISNFYSLQSNFISVDLFKQLFPIGSIQMFGIHQIPIYQNEFGISWEMISDGYSLVTTTDSNVTGTYGGSNKLYRGHTESHTLTIDELPSHTHVQGAGEEFPRNGYNQLTQYRNHNTFDNNGRSVNTYPSGGNQGHDHGINLSNINVLLWRRRS